MNDLSDVFTARTYGDFFRQFDESQLHIMQSELTDLSLAMRFEVMGKTEEFILDLDSTHNLQYCKKMEGVRRNYKGFDSLDTIQAFGYGSYKLGF